MVFRKTLVPTGYRRKHFSVNRRKFIGGSIVFDESPIDDAKQEVHKTKIVMSDIKPHSFQTGKTDMSYVSNPHKKKPIKLLL